MKRKTDTYLVSVSVEPFAGTHCEVTVSHCVKDTNRECSISLSDGNFPTVRNSSIRVPVLDGPGTSPTPDYCPRLDPHTYHTSNLRRVPPEETPVFRTSCFYPLPVRSSSGRSTSFLLTPRVVPASDGLDGGSPLSWTPETHPGAGCGDCDGEVRTSHRLTSKQLELYIKNSPGSTSPST